MRPILAFYCGLRVSKTNLNKFFLIRDFFQTQFEDTGKKIAVEVIFIFDKHSWFRYYLDPNKLYEIMKLHEISYPMVQTALLYLHVFKNDS